MPGIRIRLTADAEIAPAVSKLNLVTHNIRRTVVTEASRAIAERAFNQMIIETRIFKRPTGRFKSRIQADPLGFGRWRVSNSVPYSRWLEHGHPSTRFRGYQIWARGAAKTRLEAAAIVRTHIDRVI